MRITLQESHSGCKKKQGRAINLGGSLAIETGRDGEWIAATRRPDGGYALDSSTGLTDQEIIEVLELSQVQLIPEPLRRAMTAREKGGGQ